MTGEGEWRGDPHRPWSEMVVLGPGCGLPRRSRRVLAAAEGHSENSSDRKSGDGHPEALLGRTPSRRGRLVPVSAGGLRVAFLLCALEQGLDGHGVPVAKLVFLLEP